MIGFQEYFKNSIEGVINNPSLMGIYLSLIAFVLMGRWESFLYDKSRKFKLWAKIALEVLFFIFVIPASLILLMFFIFIFWLISFLF